MGERNQHAQLVAGTGVQVIRDDVVAHHRQMESWTGRLFMVPFYLGFVILAPLVLAYALHGTVSQRSERRKHRLCGNCGHAHTTDLIYSGGAHANGAFSICREGVGP